MRIALHHRTRAIGAEGVHILGIAQGLREIGHEVVIVSPRGVETNPNGNPESSHGGFGSRVFDWISSHAPEFVFEICELGYNVLAYRNIRRLLRQGHVDLVYERYAFFTWSGGYLARKWRIPYFVEVNEIAGVERVRGQLLVPLSRRIEKKIFKNADAVIVVSEFLKDRIAENGIDAGKIHVRANAADVRMFHPDVDGFATRQRFHLGDRMIIGFTGSLLPWHNLELLFEAVADVLDEGDSDVRVFLVGKGSYRGNLERLAATGSLKNHVVFAGAIDYAQVPQALGAMDICVVPHSNEFRSPIKLFEYMAMEKAVVAPDIRPIAQVIRNGENGLLFKAGDRDSLKRAIVDLIRNPGKRAELGRAARQTICESHTWGHNAREIVSICRGIRSIPPA